MRRLPLWTASLPDRLPFWSRVQGDLPGGRARGIFYDAAVLARAPQKMTAAGFGDILAKLIAILDWRLAWRLKMRIIAL